MCTIGKVQRIISRSAKNPVIAIRVWKIYPPTPTLWSTWQTYHEWKPGTNQADRVPTKDVRWCGLHAYKTMKTAKGTMTSSQVVGRVKLWGKIVVHERGYRAQYAEVASFAYAGSYVAPSTLEALKARFNVGAIYRPPRKVKRVSKSKRPKRR